MYKLLLFTIFFISCSKDASIDDYNFGTATVIKNGVEWNPLVSNPISNSDTTFRFLLFADIPGIETVGNINFINIPKQVGVHKLSSFHSEFGLTGEPQVYYSIDLEGGHVGGDLYAISPDSSVNYFEITAFDPVNLNVKGNFEFAFVYDTFAGVGIFGNDDDFNILFKNGTFDINLIQ